MKSSIPIVYKGWDEAIPMGGLLYCPACDGCDYTELGTLGRLQWFRCRCCGMEFNVKKGGGK